MRSSKSYHWRRAPRRGPLAEAAHFQGALPMRSYTTRALLAVSIVLSMSIAPLSAQQGALQTAANTLGATRIKTLQIVGSGANFSVGQNYLPSDPWPRVTVKSFTESINYVTTRMRLELMR